MFQRTGSGTENQPGLLEKCWKTSAQEALTTWPASALGQHLMSSHSVEQPAEKEEPGRDDDVCQTFTEDPLSISRVTRQTGGDVRKTARKGKELTSMSDRKRSD